MNRWPWMGHNKTHCWLNDLKIRAVWVQWQFPAKKELCRDLLLPFSHLLAEHAEICVSRVSGQPL